MNVLNSLTNTRSRKYQLTINNPIEKGYTHEKIKEIINSSKYVYYCMCDELGENCTPHTHIYIYYKNAVYFSTIKNYFPEAHIETALGNSQQNKDYIRKEGSYIDSEKKETNIIETFEEYGEIPMDTFTKNSSVSEKVLQMIEDGFLNAQIIRVYPSYATKISHLDQARQTILEDKYKEEFRTLDIKYIYGETGTGKTRSVMEEFGYINVYKVTNYEHAFDNYKGEDVILFDEYRSSLPISDMLQYLDGYPCRLPARYADKIACYTKVRIVSNISIDNQYKNIQVEQPATYNALLRRINEIIKFELNNGDNPFFNNDDKIIKISEFPTSYEIK